ncbi:MAG: DMT family transporter [Rhodobacteraceae bacterium]|nr:DMT family transporter [Paracoccaceae bacterium]
MNEQVFLWTALLLLGAGWGLTMPMTRIAVSTGHGHFGLIFWQLVFSGACLAVLAFVGGRRRRIRPLTWPRFVICTVIAVSGTIAPNTFSYQAAVELPAGVMSIIISLVPMFALPIAILVGNEKPRILRMVGILFGAAAIVLLLGPDASLPNPAAAGFVLLAMIAPLCYAAEANIVGKMGLAGLNPVEAIFWASLIGIMISVPLTALTGHWIDLSQVWGAPEYALLGLSVLHAFCYAGYVWLVRRAGTVFAAQVAYIVTGFGVFWSIILLDERYSGWIWGAVVLMTIGLVLVQPGKPSKEGRASREVT